MQICGLVSTPQHNHKWGVVLLFDASRKRYSVRVEGDSQAKPLGLKAANLQHGAPVEQEPADVGLHGMGDGAAADAGAGASPGDDAAAAVVLQSPRYDARQYVGLTADLTPRGEQAAEEAPSEAPQQAQAAEEAEAQQAQAQAQPAPEEASRGMLLGQGYDTTARSPVRCTQRARGCPRRSPPFHPSVPPSAVSLQRGVPPCRATASWTALTRRVTARWTR